MSSLNNLVWSLVMELAISLSIALASNASTKDSIVCARMIEETSKEIKFRSPSLAQQYYTIVRQYETNWWLNSRHHTDVSDDQAGVTPDRHWSEADSASAQ